MRIIKQYRLVSKVILVFSAIGFFSCISKADYNYGVRVSGDIEESKKK